MKSCASVLQDGTDDEILEWCFEKGRRVNEGDLFVWNGFATKLGWRDRVTPRLEARKKESAANLEQGAPRWLSLLMQRARLRPN